MSKRSSLRRKIWVAFILQAAAIGFAAVLGVYGASAVLKHVLIQRALQQEAVHYWTRRELDPRALVPDTYNMNGYLIRAGAVAGLPKPLQPLQPGFHSLPRAQGGSLVLVEDRAGQRLYLLFKQEQVDSLAFWFGMAPLALVLAVVYLIAWTTYRTSLHDFASRIGSFVEREHNFTRDASHELRTPLTVIRVAGDMMADDESLSPMARRSLKRIQEAGRDMEALIEAFLILAREGDTGLPDEDFSVAEVVREEIDKVRPLLAGKPVELLFKQEADMDLHAPPRVLSVLLGNLLRNACHYTDRGTITVTVRRAAVVISDTGIGMSSEELVRVFEPFFRAGDRRVGGQGIGLSIVRRLSDRYGWPVRLSSEPGQGTTAIISFPSVS